MREAAGRTQQGFSRRWGMRVPQSLNCGAWEEGCTEMCAGGRVQKYHYYYKWYLTDGWARATAVDSGNRYNYYL